MARALASSPSIRRSSCSSMMSLHTSMHSSQMNTCRAGNQLVHFMLALATEGTIENRLRRRSWMPGRRAGQRLCRIDLDGQDVPVLVAERLRNQLQGFAMAYFHSPDLQGIAQGMRHGFRIAEIAHEGTSLSANGGDRCLPCRPVRQWRGRGARLIRSPSPKGAGGGCIDPVIMMARRQRVVNSKCFGT